MKKGAYYLIAGVIICLSVFTLIGLNVPHRHPSAFEARNSAQLQIIGKLCGSYGELFNGVEAESYPGDWSLFRKYDLESSFLEVFVTRQNRDHIGTWDNVMDWTDYVYIEGATTTSHVNRVVAYLPPGQYGERNQKKAIVLFADNHVEKLSDLALQKALNKHSVIDKVDAGLIEE